MGAACVSCHSLQPDEQLRIESCTGKSVKNGPGFFTVGLGRSGWTHKAIRLGPVDYIVVEDELSGDLRLERGPKLFFRGPFDNVKEKRTAITLKQNEYVKLMDSLTGRIRVERGEQTVYREPLEVFVDPKSPRQPHNGHRWMAFEVDLETAVLVRNQESGELRLVSKPQLFYCGMYEEIVEIRKLVRLLDYETVILKSNLGEFTFVHGSDTPINGTVVAKAIDGDADASALPGAVPRPNSSVSAAGVGVGVGAGAGANLGLVKGEEDEAKGSEPAGHGRAFFVPPYCEIESLQWSTGDKRSDKPLHVKRIDRRPMFMNYSFLCRTSDNVELSLTVTFFWQIVDVPLMLKYTSDPPGDVCHHARSAVIQHVTKVSLEEFMKNFNTIVDRAIFGRGDGFYTQRGVKIHTVEVLHFHCKDPAIEMVLQQIIQESTNRLNRLQQQESENEVAVHRLRGDIDEERLRGDLLEIRHSHHRSEALMEGEAEADRCKAFINGMRDVVEVQDAVKLFHTLRKVEIMNHLSRGPAHLYFTPQDCSLNIETMVTEGDHAPTEQKLARGRRPVPGRSGAGGSAGAGHQEATPGSQLRSQ